MKKIKGLEFTATGLIKRGRGYCRNWEQVFELAGKTTSRQQSMFKTKYEDQIKMVEFETVNAHGEVRKNVYMVASQEVVGNKDMSDYQKKAFSTPETTIKTNKERFANRVTSVMKLALKGLEESLSYNFDCILVDGDVVDMETGEIVYAKERLFKLISDIAKNVNDADEIILGVVSTLYVDLGKKVVFVKEDENGDRVVVSIDRESLVSGNVKVVKIEKEEDQTIITISNTVNPVIKTSIAKCEPYLSRKNGHATVGLWSYNNVGTNKKVCNNLEQKIEYIVREEIRPLSNNNKKQYLGGNNMRIKNVNKKELIEVVERFLANEFISMDDCIFLGEVFDNDELSDYSALEELVEILKGEVK